jgi:hypothetical protein
MPTERESGYLCTFSTSSGGGETWVRAWSAQQASEMIRQQLQDEGVTGRIVVRVVETSETSEASQAIAANGQLSSH